MPDNSVRAADGVGQAGQVLRRACDRCHAQKLSCQREESGPCTRCVKANTACTSSPSLRNRRSRPLQPRPSDTLRDTKRRAGESRSGLSTERADEVLGDLDRTVDALLRAPSERRQHYFSHGIETPDWMDGAIRQEQGPLTALTSLSGHLHRGTPPTLNRARGTGACFSSASLQLSSLLRGTEPPTPEHGSSGRQSLDAMTPYTLSDIINTGEDGGLTGDSGSAGNSEPNGAGTSVSSFPTPTVASTADSTATALPAELVLDPNSSDQAIAPPPVSAPSREQQPHTSEPADGEWLQRLVEINIQLFNHANRAVSNQPSLVVASTPSSADASDNPTCGTTALKPTGNDFDETLMLSMRFLKVLRRLHGTSSRDVPAHTAAPHPPSLDPGSTLIIYSCYIRVMELFISRLGAVRGTLDGATGSGGLPPLPLPTLAACSCSLEDYPILRLRMTLELVEEMLDVMSALLMPIMRGQTQRQDDDEDEDDRAAMPWRRGGGGGGQSIMPEVSQQALLAREETAYQIIRDVRRGLKASRRAVM